jgi:hypothetical protein
MSAVLIVAHLLDEDADACRSRLGVGIWFPSCIAKDGITCRVEIGLN